METLTLCTRCKGRKGDEGYTVVFNHGRTPGRGQSIGDVRCPLCEGAGTVKLEIPDRLSALDQIDAELKALLALEEDFGRLAWTRCKDMCARCARGGVPDGESNGFARHDMSICDAPVLLVENAQFWLWRTENGEKQRRQRLLTQKIEHLDALSNAAFSDGQNRARESILAAANLCPNCTPAYVCREHVEGEPLW